MIPRPPPARVNGTLGVPLGLFCASTYAIPRHMYVSHTVNKSRLNASVDLSVQSQSMKVKIIQAKM